NVLSPWYWAVTELSPNASAVEVVVATPLLSVPEPRNVVPLKNLTVPVGVPVPPAPWATVADSVTGWPKTGESGVTPTVVVDAAVPVTDWLRPGELLAKKFV